MAKKKVALSDGHGYLTAGKRTPDGYNENKFNSKVVGYLEDELKANGIDTLLVAPTTADTSLKARTDAANKWGADIYVSVHYNALASKWRSGAGGIETFHYEGSTGGKKLATAIHKELIKGTPLKDRGVKTGNLHEVRETAMPAALAECGFMDIKAEAALMKSTAYQKECAQEIAQGICKYFGIKYKSATKANATAEKAAVQAEKKPATNSTSKDLYRVVVDGKQVGAYSKDANIVSEAEAQLANGAKNIKIEKV